MCRKIQRTLFHGNDKQHTTDTGSPYSSFTHTKRNNRMLNSPNLLKTMMGCYLYLLSKRHAFQRKTKEKAYTHWF